jgi:fermentation-respiration switch protein FrsA (DUF1100 family)
LLTIFKLRSMLPTLLVMLVVVEVGLPLLLFLLRDRVVFVPSTRPAPEEGLRWLSGRTAVELVRIPRSDGRLLAAYDARPLSGSEVDGPVVIFFHGNAGNIASRAPLLEDFVAGTGARTVLFDYSGYGGNDGRPSEDEAHRDGLAVYDYLVAGGVPPERLVLYGESLGAAVALGVAVERECAGVVAQSAFSSLSSMALRAYPWLPLAALLTRGAFPSIERVREMDVPLLVAHGTRDGIIPFAEGERLHAAAEPSAEFVPVEGADHNDFFAVAGTEYLGLVGARLRRWTRSTDL